MLFETAFAQTPGAAPQTSSDPITSLLMNVLPFVLIIGIFYFLMIRPQQKRQKEAKLMLEQLKKGDKVVTSSGIHGVVSEVQDNIIVVQIADNVRVRFEKVAITTVAQN